MEPTVTDHLHPLLEPVHVIDALGLDEVDPGGRLFPEPDSPEFEGVAEWILRGADEEVDLSVDFLLAAQERSFVAQRSNTINQLNGVKVVNIFCVHLVSKV